MQRALKSTITESGIVSVYSGNGGKDIQEDIDLRFTSGVPPADLLVVSIVVELF